MFNLPSVYDSPDYQGRPSRKMLKQLKQINQLQDTYRNLTLDELRKFARGFNARYKRTGELDIIKLYACAREVTYRLLGKFHYDVQIIGALAALERNAIQMSTGSGKTITIILPALAHGMTHKGCHVLTVNDYLSKRDWEEVSPVYHFFGLTSAYVSNDDEVHQSHAGFMADITYCTNTTLGFAYLNSALASGLGQDIKIIDRPLHVAIIDEMDEILMDDARNPLIIANNRSLEDQLTVIRHRGRVYKVIDVLNKLRGLKYLEYDMDDGGNPFIGDKTWDEIQELFEIDSTLFGNPKFMHVIDQSIHALFHLKRYVDYVVADEPDPDSGSRIILIDKATGRLSHGRTLNGNLHAFVEMKEGVYTGVASESTLQITYQVLFNLYDIITGVTGTLGTSFKEFDEIYNCDIVVVPDKFPNQLTQQTRVYPTDDLLWRDMVEEVRWLSSAGYPILIGAASDGEARFLSDILSSSGVQHRTLLSIDTNEEEVIENAGKVGSIVVTTDIMGRGTDIHLADDTNDKGLVVFQVGPRPNSRVERQFAGRAGRQGLPGTYYRLLSLTDWDEMGWVNSDLDMFNKLYREGVEGYGEDILMHGSHPQYTELVNRIDQALHAKESAISQSRIQEFKSTSVVDLIQTALIKQMDTIRSAIAESLEGYHYPLLQQVIYWSLPESLRESKSARKEKEEDLIGIPIRYLQTVLYEFSNSVIYTLIPRLREYADDAGASVRLAGNVSYPVPPEIYMNDLIDEFFKKHREDLQLKI